MTRAPDVRDPLPFILSAALHLFDERGFDAVTMDDIGKRAGRDALEIQQYFDGTDEILCHLLDEAIDRVLMSSGGQFDDCRAELEHLVRAHVRRILDDRVLMRVWTKDRRSIPSGARARLHARIDRYTNRWVNCLAEIYPAQPEWVLAARVHAAHSMIGSAVMRQHHARDSRRLPQLLTCGALTVIDHYCHRPRRGSGAHRSGMPV